MPIESSNREPGWWMLSVPPDFALERVATSPDELRELVLNGAGSAELKQEAIRLGMRTLRASALANLESGTTTLSEVVRVSAADR